MATETRVGDDRSPGEGAAAPPSQMTLWEQIRLVLSYVGSLKLTVLFFALGIFLVFAGTMAQTQMDVWEVVNRYFRAPVAKIDLQIFFPPSFFPSKPQVSGWFPFPGGWLIGGLLLVNLAAASVLRYPVQARGARLAIGLVVTALGAATIWLVVASGSNKEGLHYTFGLDWSVVWNQFLAMLALAWLAAVAALGVSLARTSPKQKPLRWLLIGTLALQAVLGVGLGWLIYRGQEVRLDDSNMRILWQLMKATFAALVLQAGCSLLFKKKGALVVVHAGVVLMMLGELLVGLLAVEARMTIAEGETVNYVEIDREHELAVVDPTDPRQEEAVVVPGSMLRPGERIAHDYLPLEFEVLEYYPNSVLEDVPAGRDGENPATAGIGFRQNIVARPARQSTGTESKVDFPSAYVRVFAPGEDEPIGDYLMSRYLIEPNRITVDGKTYEVSLRAKRQYKSYSMRLIDVRKDDYVGTDTPKNYSSEVHLSDPARDVDRDVKIWMNNPLRYGGETFYQSNYYRDPRTGVETTGFSVVNNTGWMIPYVGCMVVAVGLLVQFGAVLIWFAQRTAGGAKASARKVKPSEGDPTNPNGPAKSDGPPNAEGMASPDDSSPLAGTLAWVLPAMAVGLASLFFMRVARLPEPPEEKIDLVALGRLPVAYQGRVKPLDTLARNTLRIVSDRETFRDAEGNRQPAIRWLMDMVADIGTGRKHRVFRIRHPQLLYNLDLEPRKGNWYAPEEFDEKLEELGGRLMGKDPEKMDLYDKKLLELWRNRLLVEFIAQAFRIPDVRPDHIQEDVVRAVQQERQSTRMLQQFLNLRHGPPLVVPVADEEEGADGDPHAMGDGKQWRTLGMASLLGFVQRFSDQKLNPALGSICRILIAYTEDDAETLNHEVAEYRAYLAANPPHDYDAERVEFESRFNHAALFFWAWILYIVAFALSCLGLLLWFWQKPIGRTIFWFLVVIFIVHAFALAGRVMISGRPPVTNLYSSAVFIGWVGVLFGLVIQAVFRIGIGNLIASLTGMATLNIAYVLAADGDTFKVMQAVLDTNFWLTTHVLTIALGYAATFVAGALGVIYVLAGVATPTLNERMRGVLPDRLKAMADQRFGEVLARMIYGVLCFALFFSFVGTVLGGLWADDSWGRFWGWDPKENGALIIVLWNALVLHARWGRMIGDRGLAVLAVAGNICTAWSWFGVNELGVGLHSYGFTEGVLMVLGIFVASQLAVIAVGLLPLSYWWSHRRKAA